MRASAASCALDEGATPSPRIAVIGSGISGAACAYGLRRAGFDVTVFDRSKVVGGRMATRHETWLDAAGSAREADFDHGCGQFRVKGARLRVVVERAVKLGFAAHWRQDVHAPFSTPRYRQVVVPTPDMPALCRHLLSDAKLNLSHAVTGLQQSAGGWWLSVARGRDQTQAHGPFDRVVLALPPAEAARMLAAHRPDWARALSRVRATPCWTLMAVSDDIDWPWDSALMERGELARIARNDRKPGRESAQGRVPWVAQATPAWSLAHLHDPPADVIEVLSAALARQLTSLKPPTWHHRAVHRWEHARLGRVETEGRDFWWDDRLGLGVCGDAFGEGNVEAAWRSGDELADAMSASIDETPEFAYPPRDPFGVEPAFDLADAAR